MISFHITLSILCHSMITFYIFILRCVLLWSLSNSSNDWSGGKGGVKIGKYLFCNNYCVFQILGNLFLKVLFSSFLFSPSSVLVVITFFVVVVKKNSSLKKEVIKIIYKLVSWLFIIYDTCHVQESIILKLTVEYFDSGRKKWFFFLGLLPFFSWTCNLIQTI